MYLFPVTHAPYLQKTVKEDEFIFLIQLCIVILASVRD